MGGQGCGPLAVLHWKNTPVPCYKLVVYEPGISQNELEATLSLCQVRGRFKSRCFDSPLPGFVRQAAFCAGSLA